MPNTARNYPYPASGARPAASQISDLAAAISADIGAYEGALFSARSYGASGFGTLDDSAALQRAINAAGDYAAANGGGATVIVEPGQYLIGPNVWLAMRDGVTMACHGAYFLKDSGATEGFIYNFKAGDSFPGYTGIGNFRIFGGIWDGNALNSTDKYDLFNFCHGKNILVKDAVFRNVISYHALEFNSTDTAWAINCRFEGFWDRDGTRTYSEAIQIDTAVSGSSTIGPWDGTHSKNITIFGCSMEGALDGSLGGFGKLTGSHTTASGQTYDTIKVVGSYSNGSLDDGIQAYNWSNANISHNVILSSAQCGIQATMPDPANVGFSCSPKGVNITGNIVSSTGNSAPTIGVYGFSTSCAYQDVTVSRNYAGGSNGNGVFIELVSQRLVCAYNNLLLTGSNGVNFSGCVNGLIVGNICEQPGSNYGIFIGQITTSQGTFSSTDIGIYFNFIRQASTSTANIRFSTGAASCLLLGNMLRKGSGTVNALTQGNGGGTNTASQNDCTGFGDLTTTLSVSSGTLNKTIAAGTNIGTNIG